jgi:hypothetical protein
MVYKHTELQGPFGLLYRLVFWKQETRRFLPFYILVRRICVLYHNSYLYIFLSPTELAFSQVS